MKSFKTVLVLVLLATTIAASTIAWKQYQELARLRATAMSADERADLQKRVWDAQTRAERAEAQAATMHTAVADNIATSAAPGDDTGGDQQTRVIGAMVNTWVGMMNDPEALRLMSVQQRVRINSGYADLFKKLQLPADKLEQFKAELLEKQTSRNDALLAAAQQGINPMQNPQEFRQLEQKIQSDIDAQIKTTLGDASFAEYQAYQASAGQRSVVNQLGQALSYTATPLTTDQSAQVVQILATTGPQKTAADGTVTPPSRNNSRVTDATIAQAQGVLAPPQVQALKDIQQQQRAGEQLQKIMRENRSNNPAAGSLGGG